MLIVLAGLPGAGKSTLAKSLQVALHVELVSRDAVRMAEFPRWDEHAAKRAAFEVVRLEVSVMLRAGASVIVDGATLSTAKERAVLRRLATDFEHEFVLMWLTLPAELAAERIAADPHEAPKDRMPSLAAVVAQRFEPPSIDEQAVVLDATQDRAHVLASALEALRARAQEPRP